MAKERQVLSGAFAGVVLEAGEGNRIRVDLSALGGRGIDLIAGATDVTLQPTGTQGTTDVTHASVDQRAYRINALLPDGWVVGPVSPRTNVVMATLVIHDNSYKNWHEGEDFVAKLREQGHANARQPNGIELDALFSNFVNMRRNQNTKFCTSNKRPFGVYWTGTTDARDADFALAQEFFGTGRRSFMRKNEASAYRVFVRDEPGIELIP